MDAQTIFTIVSVGILVLVGGVWGVLFLWGRFREWHSRRTAIATLEKMAQCPNAPRAVGPPVPTAPPPRLATAVDRRPPSKDSIGLSSMGSSMSILGAVTRPYVPLSKRKARLSSQDDSIISQPTETEKSGEGTSSSTISDSKHPTLSRVLGTMSSLTLAEAGELSSEDTMLAQHTWRHCTEATAGARATDSQSSVGRETTADLQASAELQRSAAPQSSAKLQRSAAPQSSAKLQRTAAPQSRVGPETSTGSNHRSLVEGSAAAPLSAPRLVLLPASLKGRTVDPTGESSAFTESPDARNGSPVAAGSASGSSQGSISPAGSFGPSCTAVATTAHRTEPPEDDLARDPSEIQFYEFAVLSSFTGASQSSDHWPD